MYTWGWVVFWPDGKVLIDTEAFSSEAAAWNIALGWPARQEIEAAMKSGIRVERSMIQISPMPAGYVPSVSTEPGDLDSVGAPLKPGT